MANDKNLQGVYNTLKKEGYTPPEYEQFVKDMQEDKNLQGVYNTLKKEGYTPPEYAKFKTDMFGDEQPQQTTQSALVPEAGPQVEPIQPAQGGQPKWQPSEQEKIQMSYELNKMAQDSKRLGQESVDRVKRMTDHFTPEGRRRLKAARFQAQLSGTPTSVVGLTPPAQAPAASDGQQTDGGEQQKPAKSVQSPVPYGTRIVNGKHVTEWLLPDGRLTTDLMEAGQAEYTARSNRLEHEFVKRMKRNGLDPGKPEDIEQQAQRDMQAPIFSHVAELWKEAEDKHKADVEKSAGKNWDSYAAMGGGREMRIATGGKGRYEREKSHLTRFDLQTMMDDTWERLGEAGQAQLVGECYDKLSSRNPGADKGELRAAAAQMARSLSDNVVYEYAVQKNTPKSTLEYFGRQVADMNLINSISKGLARGGAGGKTGDLPAYEAAMGEYGKNHRVAQVGGTVVGMAVDPTTWLSGGVGSIGGKLAANVGGRIVASRAANGMTRQVGSRLFTSSLGGRVLTGAAGGAANFANYEMMKEGERQFVYGGVLNPETLEVGEYSAGDVLKAGGHGLVMGGVTGTFSPLIGNVADKAVKATTSTSGKAGVRFGEVAVSTLAEGTVFSIPEWISGEGDAFDVWTDNMAMMIGFKAQHGLKSAPRVIAGLRPIKEPKTQAERNHNRQSFEERINKALDEWHYSDAERKAGYRIEVSTEEREELRRAGYGGLADLFGKDKQREVRDQSDEVRAEDGAIELHGERIEAEEISNGNRDFDGYSAMERLMEDGQVSEATRAKMYYILTGRMLPMSSVVGWNSTKNEQDGSIIVNSMNAQGGVVTSRKFKNQREADAEMGRIQRQAELNTVDIGEQYREAEADKKVFEAAVKEAYPGADLKTVEDIYSRVKVDDERVTDAMREQVRNIDAAIDRNKHAADVYRPEFIREEIGEMTGTDVDSALRKQPKDRTKEEQEAVQTYMERLYPEEFREKFNEGDAPDEPMPTPEQQEAQLAYEEAKLLHGRFEEGTPEEQAEARANMDAIALRYHEALEGMEDAFGAEAEVRMAEVQENPWDLLNNPELTLDQQDAVLYFINSRAALDGVQDAADASADRKREAATKAVEDRTHHQTGIIQPIILKFDENGHVGDREVYLVNGNVALHDDGITIDALQSDNYLIYFDKETGMLESTSPDKIERLVEAVDPQMELDGALAEIEAQRNVFPSEELNTEESAADILQHDGESLNLQTEKGAEDAIPERISQTDDRKEDGETEALSRVLDVLDAARTGAAGGERSAAGTRESGGRSTNVSGREIEARAAEAHAKETGRWIPMRETLKLGRPGPSGNENDTFISPDNQYYYKVNNLMNSGGEISQLLEKVRLHNELFPETAYEYVGMSGYDGRSVYPVLRQPLIADAVGATPNEISDYMTALGYERTGEYAWSNGIYEVSDMRPRNVLKDADGDIYVVDAEIKKKKRALDSIPMHPETGEPMFEAVDKATAWEGLVEVVGGEQDAAEIAMAQIEQASTDLEALKKKPPTLKAPKLKGSPLAMAQAKREAKEAHERAMADYRNQLAEAEARHGAWNSIMGVYNSRNAERRAQEEAERMARDAQARDEAVARFEEEQRVKAEKQAEQEAVGTHAVNPKIKERWDSAPKLEGNPDVLTLADGSPIRGRYVLTEAGAASASHDAWNAYKPTEGFPVDANGQSVNDRDYERDKDAQHIVEQMAGAYDSRALQTPVIVSRDGVVLSGNNRTMSGDLAARRGTDKAYVDYLREFSSKYGFTPEQMQDMHNPRLVFVPDEAMPYDATTFSRFNAQEMKSQSKPEAAVKLGKIVSDDVFAGIVGDIARYDRLSDFYADEKAVAHALGALQHAGVINDKQMPEMRTGTALSAAGKELIENTLIGKVFQNSPDAVREIIAMPTLRQSVVMGLNEMAVNRSFVTSDYDLSSELDRAVDLVYKAKTAQPDVYAEGVPVSPFGSQAGLFDDETGDSRVTDGATLLLADVLNSGRPSDLRKVLATYNAAAVDAVGGQIDMFSGSVPTKEEILTIINEHFRKATPKEQQTAVNAAIVRRREAASVSLERGQEMAEPTEAQKKAGNYKMKHVRVDGHDISIENEKGSVRRGRDAGGKEWESEMHNDYGYIRGTEGVDGDHIDVFLSDTPKQGEVFVVDQYNPDGSFDEHKVMYGFANSKAAREAYLSNYEKGWEQTRRLDVTGVSKDEFKNWIQSSKHKTKPFAEYKSVTSIEENTSSVMSDEEVADMVSRMKGLAVVAPHVEVTDENWKPIVSTPLGEVKMGGNQKDKLFEKGRADQYGMLLETLSNPNAILEERDKEDNIFHERPSSYLFIKTFQKEDGSKYVHFESVTVSQDGLEVSISSHIIRENQLRNKMKSDRLLYKATALDESANPSAEQPIKGGSLSSDGKVNTLSSDKQESRTESSKSYTITPATYTNKKGKQTPMHRLEFGRELTKEEESAVKKFASEKQGDGHFLAGQAPRRLAPVRGWKDRENGGWLFRTEEDARKAGDLIGNEEAVADAQPLSREDIISEVRGQSDDVAGKPKKALINRVNIEDLAESLRQNGEAKLSDHAEPMEPKPEVQITDEMEDIAKQMREILGVDDSEVGGVHFRDPDELKPEQKRKLVMLGIDLTMRLFDQGKADFPTVAKVMVGMVGEKIKPWIKAMYKNATIVPGYEEMQFSSEEEIDRFDIANFDKPSADVLKQAEMIVAERKAREAAERAEKEVIETRNQKRKEYDKQTEADTATLGEKAEAVASKAESVAETSDDRTELTLVAEEIDETLDEVNEQLALLGYYEADADPKDFNESFGYRLNAEKKAVADATKLAKQLIDDLGIDLQKATTEKVTDRKGNQKTKKKPLAVANSGGPAVGVDIVVNLPLEGDHRIKVTIDAEPVHERGGDSYSMTRGYGENLEVQRIMVQAFHPGEKRSVGMLRTLNRNATYAELRDIIKREANGFSAKQSVENHGYKVGEKVWYTRNDGKGKRELATIVDFGGGADVTLDTGMAPIMYEACEWSQIEKREAPRDIFEEAALVAEEARSKREVKKTASTKNKQSEVKPEHPIGDLFSGLFAVDDINNEQSDLKVDEFEELIDNEQKTDLRPRPGFAERERGHEPQQNEPVGESQRNETERTDGRGMGGRGVGHSVSDTERSRGVSRPHEGTGSIARLPKSERKNSRNNYVERGIDYAPKGDEARIKANLEAIRLAKQLLESGEEATPKQMAILRKFSGWGGLGKAFNEDTYGAYNADGTTTYLRSVLTKLLGEQGFQDAIDSRRSAYYTPAEVIDTMWDIVKAMGFKGGNILEGSAGIGNILGLMPRELSDRSNIHAVEIDSTTGGILSLLYPDARVEIQGFQDTRIRNNSVDLAITNVPFVTGLHVIDKTGDKDLSTKFRDIHDFCIAKNIRKLREGGIGVFITSSGTMDNSARLRAWITNEGNADVVGAFRMHNKTFGGTGATSDIIVVRKRVNGRVSPNAIDITDVTGVRVVEYVTEDTRKVKGQEVPIIKRMSMEFNKYFAEHPENMAGEMMFNFERGETYQPTSKGLFPAKGKPQSEMLKQWASRFSEMAEETQATESVEEAVSKINEQLGEGVKEGSMVLNSKGELCMARMGEAVPLGLNKNKVKGRTKAECFNAYTAIKKALSAVLEYQSTHNDDTGLEPLLKELNRAFDSFTRTYGNLHKNTAISFLRNDVDFSSILALETYSEKGNKTGNKVVKVGKTDIFTRRVIETEKEPQPTTIKDGIIASLYKSGGVDVAYIAEALDKPVEEVRNEIVERGLGFENPANGLMEVSYQYLSGNVREKLHIAQANNEGGRYDANITALERALPMTIPAHLIEFSIGSSWIEPKLYEDFVEEKTGVSVQLTNVGGTWFMKTPWNTFNERNRAMAVVSKLCDKTIMGHELIEAAMTNRSITVSRSTKKWDGTTETITDREATNACSTKVDEIRSEFKEWARGKMQTDPEMSALIERTYNERFNNYVPMSIPDEFVPTHFGGQVRQLHGLPFALRLHQGKAVVRGTTEPVLLAHEVGTGKTFTLITTAMEMRRLGTARKPMIVVQNATVGQFVESAKEIYPNARVLTIEEADRTAEGRKNFYAKIKYNDWDMIVVPQSVFERIPDSEERQMAYIKNIIEEKMMVLEAMRESDADGRNPIVRQAEKELADREAELADITKALEEKRERKLGKKRDEKKEATTRQNAEVRAMEMLDREVDDVENFDDMGIDAILVDEAHEYKHLGFATAMQRGVKGVDPSYSKKSQGVFLKTQAVLERNHGRNVVFATGTPISNTAAEIWTFMRYLMPADTMKEYGIYYFDDFVRNFGNISQMVEFKTSGKFDEVNRFAGYVNLPELVRIWSGVSDTVLTREAGGVSDKIPDIEGGKAQDIFLPQTRALRSVMKFVKKELQRYEEMTGKEKKENSHIPLTMYGIAKAAAVDARLVISDAEDDPNSKTNAAVRETLRSLEDSKKYKGTVAIFADNYQNKRSGFNLYEDIKAKLIRSGVPEEQIVIIKSGMTVKKKLDIFEKVNSGEIRVVMGSTFTLGTGVNIQERLHTAIHVDAPNRPMDYTQRNGRILRQGNLHKDMGLPVRVLRFGVEDSLDVTAYQRLKTKGAIADSIMNGSKMMQNSMENRVLEEEEDQFGDMTAQLSGSQYAILKNQAEREVRSLTSKLKQHEIDQIYLHNSIPKEKGFIAGAERRIKIETANLETIGKHFPNGKIEKITIGKLSFDSIEAMEDFFKEQNVKKKEAADNVQGAGEAYHSTLTVNVNGLDFVVTTDIERVVSSNGQIAFDTSTSMTLECEELGIKEDVPYMRLKEAMKIIAEDIATGARSQKLLKDAQYSLGNHTEQLSQMEARYGKEFPYTKELAAAKERLEEYTEKMREEMMEKEKKYAEMDKGVEAASDVELTDEDDTPTATNGDKAKFRDGESDGERLLAIRGLEPIMVARNDMSRAELREVYNNLPSVEKDGREIEFYRSAFKKIYKEGGLFGQIVPVLDEVLEQSVLAYSERDGLGGVVRTDGTVHKEHKNVLSFDNYIGKVRLGEVEYYVRTTVQTEKGQSGTHSFFVSNVEVYENPAESRTIPITSRGTTDLNRISDAKLRQFFEHASSELLSHDMRKRAMELSEKLHTPIKLVDSADEAMDNPSARHRQAKGWTTDNGEIVVIAANHSGVADIENTVVHEIVGHDGLEAMIGPERMDEFVAEVYDHAGQGIKKKIDARADKEYTDDIDRMTRQKGGGVFAKAEATVEANTRKRAGHYQREATKEYMADMAGEIGDKGFERMSQEEQTLWGKIKAKVQQFLDKFLRGLKIAKSIRLTDKDIAYILYKAWKYKRGGGVFAKAEDIVMRRKTSWGESQLVEITEQEKQLFREDKVADKIEALFDDAVAGNLTGKPVEVGKLTQEGKSYLENLSGIEFKDNVSFVLNPSDLVHMYRDHYGDNEKDKGNNIPLTKEDIRAIANVISHPQRVIYGVEPDGLKLKLFYFLAPAAEGTYNLLEIYGDRKGNLTAKTFYKTKKAVSQRVLSLMKSEHLTSATDGASLSDAKLPKFFEYPKSDNEPQYRFRDGGMGLEEAITKIKVEAAQANSDNLQAKRDAMRAIGGNLNHLRRAMARQKEYDLTTVKSISDLAKVLLDAGLLDDLSKYETMRILGTINNVVGKQDVSRNVQKLMDIMVDNQLRMGANALGKLLTIKGNRVDTRGVEVQGELDPEGVAVAKVVRKSTSLPKDEIDDLIADAVDRMSHSDTAIADEAAIEYAGLQLARQFVENITESKAEEKALRESIRQAKADKDAGMMDDAAYKQYVEATEDAIRQNKIERAEAYHEIVAQVGGIMSESIERAKAWREAEKERVEAIHHNANSDMQGRPTDEHHKDDRLQKLANNSAVRFLLAPLATFDQMLRMFGQKNARGEGYLWNRFMRGWVEATEREYTGYRDALKRLDEKVSEVYGRKMKWGDLFAIDRRLPRASVSFMDGGEMMEHELTQGNLLYIYMADKMADGRMKLRKMGITENDIENIKNFIDPKFLELADWIQEELLVEKRNEYNEVHKRMFGASMAAIDNYFPLKILANARLENVDVADDTTDTALPATSTGSIIKRRRNNLALDVTGANAFSVVLDHVQQMERWAAFAEFNRDLNTLLSYKRFRNQVMNMDSVYGGGKTLWNNFRNVCSMAAGAYRPPVAALDKAAVNIAKGVTAAKVSFRVFTALKQFLSMPAYLSDSNPLYLAENIATPWKAWSWAMDNLPLFEKRWKSRMAGDPRLLKSEMDWKAWRSNIVQLASRVGMSPNAFVDALTVAIGAHSMYRTKKKKYLRWGMSEADADKRAKQDATILFNQTQQSSESAFLSTIQVDRSWLSVLFTVFRNSSMSYTRQQFDAIRNLARRLQPGYAGLSEEFMAKQMRRDGIDPDKADKEAKREYRRGILRDVARVAVFGYILQLAWNMGAYLPYLLLGDDDEEKDKMWDDIFNHTYFGSVEGLTGGDVYSAAGQMLLNGDNNWSQLTKEMPLAGDLATIYRKMGKDNVAAMNDVVNLLAQSSVGVNPQSLTDAVVAVMDVCGDDAKSSRECALLIARVVSAPQSQLDKIYFDELGLSGDEASRMTPQEIAERYARYKTRRGAPLTGWAYSPEEREKVMDKYRAKSNAVAKERLARRTAGQTNPKMAHVLGEYDAVKERISRLNKLKQQDEDSYYQKLGELEATPEYERYLIVKAYKHDVNELTREWLRSTTPEQLDSCVKAINARNAAMIEELLDVQQ